MNIEQEKLISLLSSLDDYVIEKLVNLSYSMRVKHPRPRAGMHRFVLCSAEVDAAVFEVLGKKEMRFRLALPATKATAELVEKTRLEVYCEDATLFCILPLAQLSEKLASAIRAELLCDIRGYVMQTAASAIEA